ncbi:putative permease [Pseudomonas sp. GM84]|uniref:sulfite exporter TauE/SafE family protein n=1 Tax=Pseudomonas sp. GM84 TaxID=1144340 RepID=UPI00026F937D|nr:sulfite exporter TauE/SafE family protein [Pseudomonas sp. GM84]EJN38764.1 putative permease [Pseudomonas sp. GM84]
MDSLYLIAVGAIVAGFVQGLSGFAFGMVAMSFWAWGLEPRLAASLTVFGSLAGQLIAVFSVRRGFSWPLLWPFVLGGLAGIPLGVWVLPYLNMLWFKAVFGTLLVLWCPLMLLAPRLPRLPGNRLADGAVGMLGGALGGIGGFTGTVPTLWCTLRGFERDTQRAVIQNFNLSMLLVTLLTYLGTGVVTRDMLPSFGVVLLAMALPALLGTRVYLGISEQAFRRVVLGLLTLSGVAMLMASLPQLLGR